MNQTTSILSFDAFRVSIEVIGSLRSVVAQVRKHDGPLATQMRRAASSVSLNVAEGTRREGRDKLHLWRIAAGSAQEVVACLHVAAAWQYVKQSSELDALFELLDRRLAILWRLTH